MHVNVDTEGLPVALGGGEIATVASTLETWGNEQPTGRVAVNLDRLFIPVPIDGLGEGRQCLICEYVIS